MATALPPDRTDDPAGLPAEVDSPRSRLSLGCLALLIVGGGAVALLVGLAVVVFAWRAGHLRAVAAEYDRLREAGKPVTPAELDAAYTIDPDRPDATAAWMEAIVLAEDPEANAAQYAMQQSLEFDDRRINVDAIESGDLADVVSRYGPLYEAIERAAAVGSNVRYPSDYSAGFAATLEPAQSVRAVARWLDLRIILAIHGGRTDDAIDDLERLHALAQTLAAEPILICQLIRVAVVGMTMGRVEDLLADRPLTAAQLDRLAALLDAMTVLDGLPRALDGERACVLGALNGEGLDEVDDDGTLTYYRSTPFAAADQRVALEIFREMDEAAVRDDPVGVLDGMEAAGDRLERQIAEAYIPPLLTRTLMPALETAGRPSSAPRPSGGSSSPGSPPAATISTRAPADDRRRARGEAAGRTPDRPLRRPTPPRGGRHRPRRTAARRARRGPVRPDGSGPGDLQRRPRPGGRRGPLRPAHGPAGRPAALPAGDARPDAALRLRGGTGRPRPRPDLGEGPGPTGPPRRRRATRPIRPTPPTPLRSRSRRTTSRQPKPRPATPRRSSPRRSRHGRNRSGPRRRAAPGDRRAGGGSARTGVGVECPGGGWPARLR